VDKDEVFRVCGGLPYDWHIASKLDMAMTTQSRDGIHARNEDIVVVPSVLSGMSADTWRLHFTYNRIDIEDCHGWLTPNVADSVHTVGRWDFEMLQLWIHLM